MPDQELYWKLKRNLIRDSRIPPPKKIRVRDEGRRVNKELVDLDLRSTFKVVLSKQQLSLFYDLSALPQVKMGAIVETSSWNLIETYVWG